MLCTGMETLFEERYIQTKANSPQSNQNDSEFKGLSYEERLRRANLTSLEDRRTRGDLIQVFKLVKGLDRLDVLRFFQFASNNITRGHRYKLIKNRSKLDVRKYFFSQRIVDRWNGLPAFVVEAETLNTFKNRLDKFLEQDELQKFEFQRYIV